MEDMSTIENKHLLLSAYACHPEKGSEPGLGWENFVTLSKQFDKITLLTRDLYKTAIESNSFYQSQKHVTAVYYEMPSWLDSIEKTRIGFQLHPYLWEVFVFFHLKKKFKKNQFDFSQKVTTGSYRFPSLTWYFAKSFTWGPLASGERFPFKLIQIFSLRGKIRELFRMFIQRAVLLDPLILTTLIKADQIIAISEDTRSILPAFARKKAVIKANYISIKPEDYNLSIKDRIVKDTQKLKLLFIGRMQEWKGVMFTLQALQKIHHKISYEFTLVGDGPDLHLFKDYAQKHKLKVTFITQWVERRDLSSYYFSHHLFMFPCLHAVTGYVFLESLLHEIPVLALDITGSKELVGNDYGIEISTKNKTKNDVVNEIADQLYDFFEVNFSQNIPEEACRHDFDNNEFLSSTTLRPLRSNATTYGKHHEM